MKCKERVKMEIQLWRSILCPYELAVRELEVKFNHIIDECKENDVYCPIEQVEGRVKSVSSILEKMQRKHIPMERMEEELEDIAGVRIICQFEEDIFYCSPFWQDVSDIMRLFHFSINTCCSDLQRSLPDFLLFQFPDCHT